MKRVIVSALSLGLLVPCLSRQARAQVPAPSSGSCAAPAGYMVSGTCPNGRHVTLPFSCNRAQFEAEEERACGIGAYSPIPGLQRRLANLNTQASSLQSQVNDLQRKNSDLQHQAFDLRGRIRMLQDQISRLDSSNADSENQILNLRKSEALSGLKDMAGSHAGGLDNFDTAPGNPLDLKSLTPSKSSTATANSLGLKPLTSVRSRKSRETRVTIRHARRFEHEHHAKKHTAVLRKPPSPGRPWAYKGWEALQAHDWKLAAAWYKEALAHDPGNKSLAGMVRYSEYAASHAPNPISRQYGGAGVYKPGTPPPNTEMLKIMDQWAHSNPGLIPPGHSGTIPLTSKQAAQSQ